MLDSQELPERNIPLIKQSKPNSCGAACLTMVYNHLGLPVKEKYVFRDIVGQDARGGQNCRTFLMCRDAINRGFASTAFFANSSKATIRECRSKDIELLVLFHSQPKSLGAHFCVVNNVYSDLVSLKDPLSNNNDDKKLTFRELADLSRSSGFYGDDIAGDNTMIAISKSSHTSSIICKNTKCNHFIPIIDDVQEHIYKVVCPYCDNVFTI